MSSEALIGAGAVVAAAAAYKLWTLFQTPSLHAVEKTCSKEIPVMGDSSKITIFGFEEGDSHPEFNLGIPDDSPFVARVEAYLRLLKQPYVKLASKGGMENPRNKVPFANIQGKMVDDSSTIIETLKASLHATLDDHLTSDQQSTKHLIHQLLFGSLYWVLLHQKFDTSLGRKTFRDFMAQQFPPVMRQLVSAFAIRGNHANLHGSGVGRMPHAAIVQKGRDDLRCLSQLLGDSQYFFGGDNPTSIDADVYSWLVLLFEDEAQIGEDPWVEDMKNECPNLVKYTARMRTLLYGPPSDP